jgi:hypothetical protein
MVSRRPPNPVRKAHIAQIPARYSPLEKTPHNARVVGDGAIAATQASIAMAAQGSGAAALNGSKGFELLIAEARSIPIQEAIAVRA